MLLSTNTHTGQIHETVAAQGTSVQKLLAMCYEQLLNSIFIHKRCLYTFSIDHSKIIQLMIQYSEY